MRVARATRKLWQSPAPEHHNDSFAAILPANPVLREFVRRALDLAEVAS
jgi:hypothetical protein